MPAIMNCLDEANECRVGGNTFQFKARQIKYFHDRGIATAIGRLKGDEGFIALPEDLEHLAHLKEDMFDKVVTPEEKVTIEEKRKEGVSSYCKKLRALIYNATVSLQKDIDKAGYKYDARTEATNEDLKRLETLSKYQTANLDLDQEKVEKFKKLEKLALSNKV